MERIIKTYPEEPRLTTQWIADKHRVDSIRFEEVRRKREDDEPSPRFNIPESQFFEKIKLW
jgi:hypothetical protein